MTCAHRLAGAIRPLDQLRCLDTLFSYERGSVPSIRWRNHPEAGNPLAAASPHQSPEPLPLRARCRHRAPRELLTPMNLSSRMRVSTDNSPSQPEGLMARRDALRSMISAALGGTFLAESAFAQAPLTNESLLSELVNLDPLTLAVISRGSSRLAQSVRLSPDAPTSVPLPDRIDLSDRTKVEEFHRKLIAAATVPLGSDYGGVALVDVSGRVIAPGRISLLALQCAEIRNYEFQLRHNVIRPVRVSLSAIKHALHAATGVADRPAYDLQALHNLPNDGRFRSPEALKGARQSSLSTGNGFVAGPMSFGNVHLDPMMYPYEEWGIVSASVPGRGDATAYYVNNLNLAVLSYHDGIATTACGWTQYGMAAITRSNVMFRLPGVNAYELHTNRTLNQRIRVFQTDGADNVNTRCMLTAMPSGSFSVNVSLNVLGDTNDPTPRRADFRVEWIDPKTGAWRTNNFFYGLFGPEKLEDSLPIASIPKADVDLKRGVFKAGVLAQPGSHVSLSFHPSLNGGDASEKLMVFRQEIPYMELEMPLSELPPGQGYFSAKIEAYAPDRSEVIKGLRWPESLIAPRP